MVTRFSRSEPQGFLAPQRFDVDLLDCEVEGAIPSDMDGSFVRVGGEWFYPPKFADDAPLHSDGYISRFRFKDGRVSYRGRFVRTPRFEANLAAGRQQFGYYRNPFTSDAAVQGVNGTVSNTAPLVHAGKLFTLKEDGLPHQLDPNTLETIGPWDFKGAWKSQTFTAHPKLDPLTGEMVAFGYEATGLASDDLFIYTIDKAGAVSHEVRVKMPWPSMIHDCAVTHRHVLIPFGGYVTSPERLRQGKIHWGWDDSKPSVIGVIPRGGAAKDMRWFKGPLRCMMHTFNAYDDGNKIVLYAPFWDGNFFPFFPPVDGTPWNPAKARAFIRKITLDLSSSSDTWKEEILWPRQVVDLGKVDPRTMTLQSRYLYTSYSDPERPFDGARAGADAHARVVNCYGRFDVATQKVDTYFAGRTHSLQECTFVPRGTREGEGYLIGVASNFAEARSELVIADAQHLQDGDIARVILPFRISSQVHGVWAGAHELPLV